MYRVKGKGQSEIARTLGVFGSREYFRYIRRSWELKVPVKVWYSETMNRTMYVAGILGMDIGDYLKQQGQVNMIPTSFSIES